jgi:hypothetical protein
VRLLEIALGRVDRRERVGGLAEAPPRAEDDRVEPGP